MEWIDKGSRKSNFTSLNEKSQIIFFEYLGNSLEDLLGRRISQDSFAFLLIVIILHDRDGLFLVGVESFFNAFDIVVGSTTSFSSFQQSSFHQLFGALQMEQEWYINPIIHGLFPRTQILHIPWKPVDQELTVLKS